MTKPRSEEKDVYGDFEDDTALPQTYIVIRLKKEINPKTLEWLVDKIRGRKRDGGAELIVLKEPLNPDEGVVLHMSASKIKFLEVAEEMEIVKEDKNGQKREFIVGELEEFLPEGMHVDDLLTVAERQTIVKHELENIRALEEDFHIPQYSKYTLYEGQSIIHVCLQRGLIEKMYPLHDLESLKKLGSKWYLRLFSKQPFEEIRQYFGEAVCLYFTFLGFYTMSLLVPTFLGFLQLLLTKKAVPFFCIFNVVWVTVFLELWRRKSNELAFHWGTIGMTSLDEPRANFHGHMGVDPVSGRVQPQYPRWKTYFKMYCVSFPVVLLCMIGAFMVMITSFWLEDYLKSSEEPWSLQLVGVPSIVYTVLVFAMNAYYRNIATLLTEWENHRTQSQFDRHRCIKLVLFEFVDNFISLFWVAFVIQDMEMLRSQLATMLIILQAINNFQEAVLPLLIKFYLSRASQFKGVGAFAKAETLSSASPKYKNKEFLLNIPEIKSDDERLVAARREANMENYEETYDDYLEMFIQFGYVVLFSSVYPIAAFWALINNVLEIRADAFKLCKIYQRPVSKKVKDIGAWQKMFEILGGLSILTNCGLMCLYQMNNQGSAVDQLKWILIFVVLEHFLLGIRYLLHIAIPDKPEWVRVALARRNHESKQALKNEKLQKNRRILTRKFKTVHGHHV